MPRREPSAFVWDVLQAARSVEQYIAGMTVATYLADVKTQHACERQLITIGEAMNRLSETDEAMAEELGETGPIVAFRNVLVHGYFKIDHTKVWDVIHRDIPPLRVNAERVWSRFAPLYDSPEDNS